jgi:uncharacterized protein
MAKSVLAKGLLTVHDHLEIEESLKALYSFIDDYRERPERLSSFILTFRETLPFTEFENMFWSFLRTINGLDKKIYLHDSRVDSNPNSSRYSFSLKSEAFFILALHPESPRWERRFKWPAIVFNPHHQFEVLRKKGLFTKIRNIIRRRDLVLQGSINPMVSDFGERSELYQYLGKVYSPDEKLFV